RARDEEGDVAFTRGQPQVVARGHLLRPHHGGLPRGGRLQPAVVLLPRHLSTGQQVMSGEASSPQKEFRWYVVRVASNREERVRDNLLARVKAAGKQDRIRTVLVPTEKFAEIKGGK